MSTKILYPKNGEIISTEDGKLKVPNNPILPFIEGDGIGTDIWKASKNVFDSAVEKAYHGKRKVEWMEVYAGEKATKLYSPDTWLPDETMEALKKYKVGIKGPMTTPIGGGIRSLNVAIRQMMDLYVCLRPVCYFSGVPSPVKEPENINMVIFRENTEDIYAGIEFEARSADAKQIEETLKNLNMINKVRFPASTSYGIKPVSEEGSKRLIRAAMNYAIEQNRRSVTLVHKGNIMKFTEGYFRKWGYELAKEEFPNTFVSWEECGGNVPEGKILIQDVIADAFLQQILIRPKEYDVIATLNLNGDYLSDALAAQVGGIGIAPGANINYEKGIAVFEATHGTAPKYTNQDKVNPSSLILSGEMMFRFLGWDEVADKIIKGVEQSILNKRVTYDFARMMDGSTEIKCSEFAEEIIKNM